MSMIMFAFIITTLFSKAKTAAAVGGLGYNNVFNLSILGNFLMQRHIVLY